MAIKDSDLIVPMRDARDEEGKLLIDGDKKHYGIAELWIDVAGEDSERTIERKKLQIKANQFVMDDTMNGILTKCRLRGRNMKNAPFADAKAYLLELADRSPKEIINLYTGQDAGLQLLILDAKERGVLRKINGWLMYGDINMGANDEAALVFLKTPANSNILKSFRDHVYPEYAIAKIEGNDITPVAEEASEIDPIAITKPKKTVSKK